MSVLACNRKDCESIMCNRLSDTHGYICEECFWELSNLSIRMEITIQEFMNTPKYRMAGPTNPNEIRSEFQPV